MKTNRPYIQTAYCPEPGCWQRWTIIAVTGFDEDEPITCPTCGGKTARVSYGGDFQGDQLRDIYKRMDEEEKKRKEEREKKKEESDGD